MSTQAGTFPGGFGPQGVTPVLHSTRPMYWSLQRELWEYRSIFIAPLAGGAVALVGFLISLPRLLVHMRAALTMDPEHQRQAITAPYDAVAALLMGAGMLVTIFYCVDALHGERQDRSILFWKSLPVSDVTTVLSKAFVGIVIPPLAAFVVTVVVQFIMLLVSSSILSGSGLSVAPLWSNVALVETSLMLLYHLLTVHIVWYAPFYAWMMLASAWAKRMPFLWAALPPLALGLLEKIAFGTTHFAKFLQHRFTSGPEAMMMSAPHEWPINTMMHITPLRYLTSPGLYLGLAVTAAFLGLAVRLRRYRDPI